MKTKNRDHYRVLFRTGFGLSFFVLSSSVFADSTSKFDETQCKTGPNIIIMRHGYGEHQKDNIRVSNEKVLSKKYHLTTKGKHQVIRAAVALINKGITAENIVETYSSPLTRTKETAKYFLQTLTKFKNESIGDQIIEDDLLLERDFGDCNGKAISDCWFSIPKEYVDANNSRQLDQAKLKKLPKYKREKILKAFENMPKTRASAESDEHIKTERVIKFVNKLKEKFCNQYEGKYVFITTHDVTAKVLASVLTGKELKDVPLFEEAETKVLPLFGGALSAVEKCAELEKAAEMIPNASSCAPK